jgi:hypothetical protein
MTLDLDEAIEIERRHIREGEARIARQEVIARLFDSRCTPEAAAQARELMAEFREIVEVAKTRLVELEQRYRGKPPEGKLENRR